MKTLLMKSILLLALFPIKFSMADLSGAFDGGAGYVPGSVEPISFEDLPAGDYPVVIVESEMKDTKDRLGRYLNLTMKIFEGTGKNRTVFDRFNLVNRNQTAVTIAKQQLEALCRAIGMKDPIRDSAQLHNKPFVIRLGYAERAKDGGLIAEGQRNEVKAYKPYEGAMQYQQPPAQATYQPQAPAYQPPAPPAQAAYQPHVPPAYQPPADDAPFPPVAGAAAQHASTPPWSR